MKNVYLFYFRVYNIVIAWEFSMGLVNTIIFDVYVSFCKSFNMIRSNFDPSLWFCTLSYYI